jgi:hypothetical protein
MTNSCHVRRASRVWWAICLMLMACLWAGSGSLRSQELPAGNTARIQISEPNRALFPASSNACDAAYAKVHYLIEELVTQRSESARLSMELAETRAKSAEIETISRQRNALLAALIAVLTTGGRREADTRLEAADLRQRLEAAQAELQRKVSENERLAAELAAAHKAADAATVMAQGNLSVIDAQIKVLHAAAGDAALASAERRAELLYAGWFDMQPAMPRQMLHLEETR